MAIASKFSEVKMSNLTSDTNTPDSFLVSVMNLNVLFPFYYHPLASISDYETRYNYQFDELFTDYKPDILCLEEVTDEYVEMLEDSDFYKSGYQHTPLSTDESDFHHPLIVTKLPYTLLYNKNRFVI